MELPVTIQDFSLLKIRDKYKLFYSFLKFTGIYMEVPKHRTMMYCLARVLAYFMCFLCKVGEGIKRSKSLACYKTVYLIFYLLTKDYAEYDHTFVGTIVILSSSLNATFSMVVFHFFENFSDFCDLLATLWLHWWFVHKTQWSKTRVHQPNTDQRLHPMVLVYKHFYDNSMHLRR